MRSETRLGIAFSRTYLASDLRFSSDSFYLFSGVASLIFSFSKFTLNLVLGASDMSFSTCLNFLSWTS